MNFLDGLILAFTQGATELLPVSSSGHLILATDILGIRPELSLLTLLHIATGLAILLGYGSKIWEIIKREDRWKTFLNIVITSIPAIILGVLISDVLDEYLYNPTFIGANLIFWGIIMIIAENKNSKRDPNLAVEVTPVKALLIGFGQAVALIPGTSRSGITTLSGMAVGLKKEDSLDYAFIAGLPLIFGAFFYEFLKAPEEITKYVNDIPGILVLVATFVIGYIFIEVLKAIKSKPFLKWFGYYRIVLGAVVLGVAFLA